MNAVLLDSLVKRILKGVIEKGATKPEQLVCASNAALTAYFSTLLNGGTRDVAERVLSSIADNFMHVAKGVKSLEEGAKKVAFLVYEGTQGMDAGKQKRIYSDVLDAVKKYSKGTTESRLTGGAIEELTSTTDVRKWPQYDNVKDDVNDTRTFLHWLQQQNKIVDYKFRPKAIAYGPKSGSISEDKKKPAESLEGRHYDYFFDPYFGDRFGDFRGTFFDTVESRNDFFTNDQYKYSAILRDAVVDLIIPDPNDPGSTLKVLDLPVQGIAWYLKLDHDSNMELRDKFDTFLKQWVSSSNPKIAEERFALRNIITPEDEMKRILFPNDSSVLATETSLQAALRKQLTPYSKISSFLDPYVKAFGLEKDKWEDIIKGLVKKNAPAIIPRTPLNALKTEEGFMAAIYDIKNKQEALKEIPLLINTLAATPSLDEDSKYWIMNSANNKLSDFFTKGEPSGYTTYAGEKHPYWDISEEEEKILNQIEEKMEEIKLPFINEWNKKFVPFKFRESKQFSRDAMTRAGPIAARDFREYKQKHPESNISEETFLKIMGPNSSLRDVKALEEEEDDVYREVNDVMNDLGEKMRNNTASKGDAIRFYRLKMDRDMGKIDQTHPILEIGYKKFFDIYNKEIISPEEADFLLNLGGPLTGYSHVLATGKDTSDLEKYEGELRKYITEEEIGDYLKKAGDESLSKSRGYTYDSDWAPSRSTPALEERQQMEGKYEKLFGKRHPKTEFIKPSPGVKIEPVKEAPPAQLPEEKKLGFWSWAAQNPVPAMTFFGSIPAAIGGLVNFSNLVGKAVYTSLDYLKPQWADWLDAHWPGGLVKSVGHALEDIADFAPAIFRDYMEATARQDAYAVQQAQVQARNDAAMKNYEQQVSYQKYVDELKDKMTKMEIEQARKEREQKEAEIEYQRNEIRRENLYKDEEDARKERNYERQYALDQQRDKINARNFNRAEEYKREKAKYDERERQRELAYDAFGSVVDAGIDLGRMVFAGPASTASAAASAAAAAVAPAPAAPAAAPVPVVPAAAPVPVVPAAAPVPVVPAAAPAPAAPAPPAPAAAAPAAAAAAAAAAPAAAAEPASKKSKKTKESTSTKSDISTGNIGKAISKGLKWYFHEAAPIEEKQEYVSQMKAKEEQQKSYKRGADLPGAGPERLVKDNIHSAPIARPVLEVAPARPADFKTTNIDAAYNRVRSRWEARERKEEEDKAKRQAQKEEDKRVAMEYLQNFKADQEVRGDAITPVSAGRQGRALTTRVEPLRPSFALQQRAPGKKRPPINLRRKPSTIFPSTLPQKKQSEEPKRKRRRKK